MGASRSVRPVASPAPARSRVRDHEPLRLHRGRGEPRRDLPGVGGLPRRVGDGIRRRRARDGAGCPRAAGAAMTDLRMNPGPARERGGRWDLPWRELLAAAARIAVVLALILGAWAFWWCTAAPWPWPTTP